MVWLIVIFISSLSLIGWMFDIDILKSLNPDYPSMKITTALMFLSCSFIYFFKDDRIKVVFAFLILSILFYTIGIYMGTPHEFINKSNEDKTIINGIPSISTMFSFFLFSVFFISCNMFNVKCKNIIYLIYIVAFMSQIALLGYIIDNHYLYFYIPNYSTGMALHTVFCFSIISYWKILTFKTSEK